MQTTTTSNGFVMRCDVAGLQSALLSIASQLSIIGGRRIPAKFKTELYDLAKLAHDAVYVAESWAADHPLELSMEQAAAAIATDLQEKSSIEYQPTPNFGENTNV